MHKDPSATVADPRAILRKWGRLEGWISVAANLLLFVLKLWAGMVSGSLALIADAWHTLTDSVSSVVVLIGVWVSGKPADEEHPFGHGRAELIASIIIGLLLAVIAFDFLIEGISRLRQGEAANFGTIAIVVTIVSILVKEGLAQFAFYTYRETGAASLRADAWHHRTDALSSVLVLGGILLGGTFWWIDGILGIGVSLMIFYAAYEVLNEGIHPLLGESPDEDMLTSLDEIANTIAGRDVRLHHIHIHRYGDHVEMTCHIRLPSRISLEEAHRITDKIEWRIRDSMNIIATIHPEPDPSPDQDRSQAGYMPE